jgi:peptidoglycan/xylan/chitin deacetylase (PgdA/CDA1 family)
VVLTFDDGPHRTFTPQVLERLRAGRVPGTFFQVGERVAASPGLARLVAARHTVANHSWAHENLLWRSDAQIRESLIRTNAALVAAGVPRPTLVRPPYGGTSSRVAAVIRSLAMRQALWNVDPQDWRTGQSADTTRRRVLAALRDGAVVLLHDGVVNSGATVAALPGIIRGARQRGYCFGTLGPAGGVRPPRPAVRVLPLRVGEPATGVTVRVPIRLSEPTSRPVSVGYVTRSGTARGGEDYRDTSGRVRLAVGQTRTSIAVRVRPDGRDEADEFFTVSLRAPIGVSVARRSARVTIRDDDPVPRVAVRDATVVEGAAGTSTLVAVPVVLSRSSGRVVAIEWTTQRATQGDAASPGRDYVTASGTVRLPAGAVRASVPVVVLGDGVDEPDESFSVRLGDVTHAAVSRGVATVLITDDDEPVSAASIRSADSVDRDVDVVEVVGGDGPPVRHPPPALTRALHGPDAL